MALINATDNSFKDDVLKSKNLVLVDFWAPWCGPCKIISPILEDLSIEYNLLKIVKINIDNHSKIAVDLKIKSIPTLILFKNGELLGTKIGSLSQKSIEEWVSEFYEH